MGGEDQVEVWSGSFGGRSNRALVRRGHELVMLPPPGWSDDEPPVHARILNGFVVPTSWADLRWLYQTLRQQGLVEYRAGDRGKGAPRWRWTGSLLSTPSGTVGGDADIGDMPWHTFTDLVGYVDPRDDDELDAFTWWWTRDRTQARLEQFIADYGWWPPAPGPEATPERSAVKAPARPVVPKARRFPFLVTLNCGMGRDSLTMLGLLAEGRLMMEGQLLRPCDVDAVLFADTGWEWPHTYALLSQVRLFCRRLGLRFLHLRKPPERGARGWVENVRAHGDIAAPAWVEGTGGWSIEAKAFWGAYHRRLPILEEYERFRKIAVTVSSSCTDNHKVAVIRRALSDLCREVFGLTTSAWSARLDSYANRLWPRPWQRHRVLIGIAADEPSRAIYSGRPHYEWPVYPLLELGLTKADEAEILARHGFDLAELPVYKSGCSMCPYQPTGWYGVLEELHPALYRRVVRYEAEARAENSRMCVVGGRPLEEAVDGWRERHPDQALDREGVLRKAYARGVAMSGAQRLPLRQLLLFGAAEEEGLVGGSAKRPPEEELPTVEFPLACWEAP